jgi:hypothetical protein
VPKQEKVELNDIADNLLILPMHMINAILKLEDKNKADAISLYIFYYYTAKWQRTNQPKAVDKYSKMVLKMGKQRLSGAQKILLKMGLIERIVKKDEKGKIKGWYIKINYLFKKNTVNKVIESKEDVQLPENELVDLPTSGNQTTNALSYSNISALSNNNINALDKQNTLSKQVDYIYYKYPSKCPITGRYTNKSNSHKAKIAKAIKKVGVAEFLDIQNKYVSISEKQRAPLKNYSTFLNNLPDFEYYSNPAAEAQKAKEIEEALREKN